MTVGISLWIDTAPIAIGRPGEDPAAPYAISGLTVSWGRPTTVDQPDASSCTFQIHQLTAVPNPDVFAEVFKLGRRIDVLAVGANDYDTTPVFAGFISDVAMVSSDEDPTGLLILTVTCDDLLADLNNRPAASVPWPKETVAARFQHVLEAARLNTSYTLASDLAGIMVRKIDADEGQTSMVSGLLPDIATSVDGVLWSAADANGDPMLVLESPALRAPLRKLALVPPYVTIVDVSAAAGAMHINPCVPQLAPVEWRQTMSDLVTGVAVTYYTPDPAGAELGDVGTTITVSDPTLESPSKPWGVRRMLIDSQLTSAVDATAVASKVLARMSTPTWRLNNLYIDQADDTTLSDTDLRKLLDLRSRHGTPLTISPLPPWAPPSSDTFTGYLEGGDLTCTMGVWSVSLWVSLATGYGGSSALWNQLVDDDNWQWQDFDPDMAWMDLQGVSGP